MALTGMTFRETFEYVSDFDPCKKDTIEKSKEAGATIWILGNLPADLRTSIQDGIMGMSDGDLRMNTNRSHMDAVRFGLKGVERYADENGKAIKHTVETEFRFGQEYQICTLAFINTIPSKVLNELGRKILDTNSVTETERKNSNTQS